jgi:nucleoside phosphorylase
MICIVSAISSEIKELLTLTHAKKIETQDIWVVPDGSAVISPLGVGYLTAAIHLQALLIRYPEIGAVIFCGTAGIYDKSSDLEIGQVVQCKDTMLCDGAAELGFSVYASIMKRDSIDTDFSIAVPKIKVSALTALTLTKQDRLAEKFHENTGCDVENMELYGIASVCRLHHITWNAMLGLSNFVGGNGHKEWLENHSAVEKIVCRHIFDHLSTEKL